MREELGVDAFKSLFIHHPTRTLLPNERNRSVNGKHTGFLMHTSNSISLHKLWSVQIIKKCTNQTLTDVFESPVEDLQLFLGEVGLLYEAVDPLRSVTHRWQFVIITYVTCMRDKWNSYSLTWNALSRQNREGAENTEKQLSKRVSKVSGKMLNWIKW